MSIHTWESKWTDFSPALYHISYVLDSITKWVRPKLRGSYDTWRQPTSRIRNVAHALSQGSEASFALLAPGHKVASNGFEFVISQQYGKHFTVVSLGGLVVVLSSYCALIIYCEWCSFVLANNIKYKQIITQFKPLWPWHSDSLCRTACSWPREI